MQRVAVATKAVDLFGAGKHGFKDGDLALGIPATDFTAVWFNDVQEELLSIIETAGLVPTVGVRTQVRQAIDIMLRKMSGAVCAAAGTADALTGDFTPDVTAFADGMTVIVRAAAANATTTPTFKPDALAAKTIVKGNNQPLVAGDIAGAGHWLELQYDLTLDKFVLLNPATGVNALGFGQTYQNVAGSRALTTTYTNSTARPIFVAVSLTLSTTTAATVFAAVNGTVVAYGTTAVGATNYSTSVGFIVPPGATYQITGGSGGVTINTWFELR